MKKFFIIFILLCNCIYIQAAAKTLKAGVSYTLNGIRTIAFEKVEKKIDVSKYKKYFVYNEFCKNKKTLFRGKECTIRKFTQFSDGDFGVLYKSPKHVGFYYDKKGNLRSIEFFLSSENIIKRITYDRNGDFDSVAVDVKPDEQYVFDSEGKLFAHWIGKNGYNEKGELFGTRN